MRRIVMFNHVTLDGFFAGTDGNLDWVIQDPEIYKEATASGVAFDTVLFGRRTYQIFESHWPKVYRDSIDAPGRTSREYASMAKFLNDADKVVFTRTLKKVEWNNSRLVPEIEKGQIESLKKRPGSDMIMFGSGSVVAKLSELRLIDEYQFIVNPVLLGSGLSLTKGLETKLNLKLGETKRFPLGSILLRYTLI